MSIWQWLFITWIGIIVAKILWEVGVIKKAVEVDLEITKRMLDYSLKKEGKP